MYIFGFALLSIHIALLSCLVRMPMELVPCSFSRNQKRRRENTNSSAALGRPTTIGNLCDSVLAEILRRLLLKQLKRCQAVSKRWYALISDPYFIGLFGCQRKNFTILFNYLEAFNEDTKVLNLLVTSRQPDFRSDGFSLSFLPFCRRPSFQESATVLASCNDLLLCCDNRAWQDVYYVCNPVTMRWNQLPANPPPRKGGFDVGLTACHYSCDDSSSTCRYAVLRIIDERPHDGSNTTEFKIKAQIFLSDTGEWREKVVSCGPRYFKSNAQRRNAIAYDGLLFFLSIGNGLMGFDPYQGGELRRFIDVPKEFFQSQSTICVGVCKESLRLFQISEHPAFIRIWDLRDYEKGEWSPETQIYFQDIMGANRASNWVIEAAMSPFFFPVALACDPDDGDVVYFAVIHKLVAKVVSFNMRTELLEEDDVESTEYA